ncbi:unnamed protein product [Aspergillus oryzae RIB40]|uniref:DNA, SC012 n=1 Tax=Aspergillus oryzae (strain ATCC 42149 / RIB 40) TaxID=510516 RepID=Q2UDU5_ASPOR|nr:unnamed protein product [Aspergillus oryzae RIB40]BAE60270.1 unnamed protein product [Aspergillus oryzae RIB40]
MLLAGCTMIALIGNIIVYACESTGVRLFGLYLFVAYAAGIPMTLSMVSSNVAGFTKKATVSAMMFIAYCTGNIVGPFLFFEREAPGYKYWGYHGGWKTHGEIGYMGQRLLHLRIVLKSPLKGLLWRGRI